MKTQLKINGELKDVEIENGEITIIEPEKKATGWEIADKGTNYYCICWLEPYPANDYRVEIDSQKYKEADYFTDKTLALNISHMQTLQRKMFRWQAENDVIFTSKYRWCIIYDTGYDEIVSTDTRANAGFLPVFSCKEKAEECIKVFKNELTWLFTEFIWRMDG